MRTAGAIVLGCKHLRAERRELRRLIEANLLDESRTLHDARVGREHAIDVGPDLDGLGAQRGAEQRRTVVAAATSECRDDAAGRGADEPADHRRNPRREQRANDPLRRIGDELGLRLGTREMIVGDHDLARVDELCGHAARAQHGHHQVRRQPLADGGDRIQTSRRHVSEHG